VDPNPQYRDEIATRVKKHDLQDKYKFLACGVEDSIILAAEGLTAGSMDTVLSIQVLCAVGDVKTAMKEVWRLLKPGGKFVFWEHGKSKDALTLAAQSTY
jgi:ubiquinone/menaquinone biosynthesis C-methylase UbiE